MMRCVVLLILGLLLSGCATKKHVSLDEADIRTEKRDSVVVEVITEDTTESVSKVVSDSTATDVTVVEIRYDTSVTDSAGGHPIASVKYVAIQKNSGHKEVAVQERDVHIADSTSLVLRHERNDSVVSTYEERREAKPPSAWTTVFGLVMMAVMVSLLLMFARWIDKQMKD